ncbi:MAG: tetratricopeptide repeat protein [bacterium]
MKSLIEINGKIKNIYIYNNNYVNYLPDDLYTILELENKDNIKNTSIIKNFISKIFINRNNKILLKSLMLIKKEDYKKAEKHIEQYIEKNINNADAIFLLSLLKDDTNIKKNLIEELSQNIDNYGNFFNKYNIGISLQIKVYDDLYIHINNDKNGIIIYLSLNYLLLHKYTKGIEFIRNNFQEDNLLVKLILAKLQMGLNNHDQAILLFQDIVEKSPDNSPIYFYSSILMGKALRKDGMLKASISILRKARRNSKNLAKSLSLESTYQLAISLDKYGRTNLAKKEYQKILAICYEYKDVIKRINKLNNI